MFPIGQTFYVTQPGSGVPGVYLTKVDIFFKSVSSTYGIELQIRTTENGVPTQERLPFGTKTLQVNDALNPPTASDDASVATTFVFDTPVFVQSGMSYAIVLIPAGGNPDYDVWTAVIGGTDVTTGNPIYTNNSTGDLFLSSNDIDWIPVITEDMKFNIYIANFTSLSGTAIFNNKDAEYFLIKNIEGSFIPGELVYTTNNIFNIAVLNVSSINGTFNVNNYVYQSNGSANTAYGYVYAANSTVIKLANTTAAFSSSAQLYNANSTSNATVVSVSQNVVTTSSSNNITLPDSSIFSVNNVIYIQTNNGSNTQVVKVTAVPTSTTIQVNTAINFSDPNSIYGYIAYNGTLYGNIVSLYNYGNASQVVIDRSTASIANNFSTSVSQRLIGSYSGASGYIFSLKNGAYDQLAPIFTNIAPANTSIGWAFEGFANNNNYTQDAAFISLAQGTQNELTDTERVVLSRSNELTKLPSGRIGNKSLTIQASLSSANNLISPVIDILNKELVTTVNECLTPNAISGYYLNISNLNGVIGIGDTVTQGNAYATVGWANSSWILINNISNGNFYSNTTIIDTSNSANALVTTAEYYSELKNNPNPKGSRYISKNVLLSSTQTAEDIKVFIGSYRPSTTNLYVYAKVLNAQDPDTFSTKDFSFLPETSSPNLLSSQVDINDRVELTYGFPTSQTLYSNGISCNTTSNSVSVFSSAGLSFGNYVYISDNTQSKFIVRKVISIVNSSVITVDKTPSFTSSNASLGLIPGLQSRTSAFLYDQNSNILRYSTINDFVYDTYSQFAIKIVPVAQSRALVPRVGDLRVLALS